MQVITGDTVGDATTVPSNGKKASNGTAKRMIMCESHEVALALDVVLHNRSIMFAIEKASELLNKDKALNNGDAVKLCKELLNDPTMTHKAGPVVSELIGILMKPTFKGLVCAHDELHSDAHETPPPSPSIVPYTDTARGDPIRIIGLFKTADQPLGLSLSADGKGRIFIARIHHGSTIDRQGLLRVGDVIREINGESVEHRTPEQVLQRLQQLSGSVTIRVAPMYQENFGLCQMFVRTHFAYDPEQDNRLASKDEAVAFKRGEILEVVDQSNLDWWQARVVNDETRGGVVPSSIAEERRRNQVNTANQKQSKGSIFRRKKTKAKKVMFSTSRNASALSLLHSPIYEEVALMPALERKTVVLTGPSRVGQRSLKDRLTTTDPARFGTTTPHTSRPARHHEEDGRGYFFVEREEMERDIAHGKYIEWEEVEGHLYGTRLDSVRNVVRSGRICVIDLKGSSLDVVRTIEFMPLIVFIAAPSRDAFKSQNNSNNGQTKPTVQKKLTESEFDEMLRESDELQRVYSHLFDLVLTNNDLSVTYERLREAMDEFASKPQWVPVEWVY